MINKINSTTNSPSFKAVPFSEIKAGKKFLLSAKYHDKALRGTERLYTSVVQEADGFFHVSYKDLATGNTGTDIFPPDEVKGAVWKFLDPIPSK